MPVDCELDRDARIVRVRAWGELEEEEIANYQARIRGHFMDGTIDATWVQVADFSAGTRVGGLTAAAIQRLAQSSPWPRGSSRIFIAPTPVMYGLGRMFQILAADEDKGLTVVHSASEADAWLQQARRSSADSGE